MADPNANMTHSTPQEVIISVIAGLIAPLLAIFLVIQLILGIQDKQSPPDAGEVAAKAVEERIKPVATLAAADANAPKVEQSGEQVFNAVCAACHTPGAMGAPKLNAKADWAPRLGQGYDTLVKHAIEGIRAMPPRGGNPDLSDTEVARAVAYMANSAGADFKEPEAASAPAATAEAGGGTIDLAKGEATYTATCAACHAAGVAGAPKSGDKAAWAPRLKTGFAQLYQSALHGKNAMPAKGGNAALSESDVASAVAYMVKQVGGEVPATVPGGAAPAATAAAAPAATAGAAASAAAPAPATAPAAKPVVADASAKGAAVYQQTCAACHAAGVAGAPKLGDKAAWAPRIAQGLDALHTSALKGKNAMPAKGGNASLADADVKAAVDYMAAKAK